MSDVDDVPCTNIKSSLHVLANAYFVNLFLINTGAVQEARAMQIEHSLLKLLCALIQLDVYSQAFLWA